MWVYILLFLFVGPEMKQDERNEEAKAVLEYEEMRSRGVSLKEIGAARAKMDKPEGEASELHIDSLEAQKEKGEKKHLEHV